MKTQLKLRREKFFYNGYTLFYDERIKKTKAFEEIK